MRISTAATAASAVIAVAAALTVAATGASAATAHPSATATYPHFVGKAGGTAINLLNGTATSGLTAASGVDTLRTGVTSGNRVLGVSVPQVLTASAVATRTRTYRTTTGVGMSAHARTAGLSLLGGVITAKAVDTVAKAYSSHGRPKSAVKTTVLDLAIAGHDIPLAGKPNQSITVPSVATVILDYRSIRTTSSAVRVRAAGLKITLLKAVGTAPANSTIYVNPVTAYVGRVGPGYAPLGGYGYATQVWVNVDKVLHVASGPTGYTAVPPAGTRGHNLSNNTARLYLPKVATIRAAGTTANGYVSNRRSYSSETAKVAGVSLLGGMITATALQAHARVLLVAGHRVVTTMSNTEVKLVIAKHAIPANLKPNTVITVGKLARIVVNLQVHTSTKAIARVLDIRLLRAAYGLPAGARIAIGTAVASLKR